MKKKAAPERVGFLAQLAQAAPDTDLGQLYGFTMATVARKSVIRLSRETKARFCKQCFVPRTPESTEWRVEDLSRAQNRPTLVIRCRCGAIQRRHLFNKPPNKRSTRDAGRLD